MIDYSIYIIVIKTPYSGAVCFINFHLSFIRLHARAIAIYSTNAAINATINSAIQLHTYLKTKEFRNTT